MQGTRILAVGLSVLLGASTTAVLRAQTAAHPDFTGAWKLNPELTQRPSEHSMEGTDPSSEGHHRGGGGGGGYGGGGGGGMGGGRGRGGGFGGGGGGYGGGGGGQKPDPQQMAKVREAMRLAMIMPERLTVVRQNEGFLLTDGDGVSQTLTPDGKTIKSEMGAIKVETKAKWEDTTLVVERKFDGGVKVTERYSLTESPRQLVVASKIETSRMSGDRARNLSRVYDVNSTDLPPALD